VSILGLDEIALAMLATRFRLVHRLVEENRHILPRAFFVPAVRVEPDSKARVARIERFDPEAVVIMAVAAGQARQTRGRPRPGVEPVPPTPEGPVGE